MRSQRQIISRIPQKGMSGEQWGLVVEYELVKIWLETMSAAELKSFKEGGFASVTPAAFAKLDAIILHQAETLGWRIELSELVQFRKSEWDLKPGGPEKHKKYGLACSRSARILQRKALPPIEDPDQWRVKQETVEELRVLLKNLMAKFALQRKGLTPKDAHSLFAATVSDSVESFPHLAANAERWTRFFEENPDVLHLMTLGDRAKPAPLYYEFLAWCSGWDPDSIRQAISRLSRVKS
jgi:hypothetical protein